MRRFRVGVLRAVVILLGDGAMPARKLALAKPANRPEGITHHQEQPVRQAGGAVGWSALVPGRSRGGGLLLGLLRWIELTEIGSRNGVSVRLIRHRIRRREPCVQAIAGRGLGKQRRRGWESRSASGIGSRILEKITRIVRGADLDPAGVKEAGQVAGAALEPLHYRVRVRVHERRDGEHRAANRPRGGGGGNGIIVRRDIRRGTPRWTWRGGQRDRSSYRLESQRVRDRNGLGRAKFPRRTGGTRWDRRHGGKMLGITQIRGQGGGVITMETGPLVEDLSPTPSKETWISTCPELIAFPGVRKEFGADTRMVGTGAREATLPRSKEFEAAGVAAGEGAAVAGTAFG